jgi:hypothetical protein
MRFRPLLLAALALPLAFALLIALAPDAERTSERADLWTGVLSGEFTPDETAVDDCAGLPGFQQSACYSQAFGNIAYRDGGAAAMTALLERSREASDTLADCHVVAHMVGVASYHGHNRDLGAALGDGSAECSGGYYHGSVAGEISTYPSMSPEELGARAAQSCHGASVDALRIECLHGIGHAAEHVYGYDIPVSLRSCEAMEGALISLGVSSEELSVAYHTCTQGVFMENRQAEGGESGRWFRSDEPVFPCLEFSEKEGTSCWDLVPGKVQPRADETIVSLQQRRFEACRAAIGVEPWWSHCIDHARRTVLASDINSLSSVDILRSCEFDPDGLPRCFFGIGFEAINIWSDVSRAKELCAGAGDDDTRESCASGIGFALKGVRLPESRCEEIGINTLVAACRSAFEGRGEY